MQSTKHATREGGCDTYRACLQTEREIDRESIEVRESRRVVLGNIQKQSVFYLSTGVVLGDIP